MELSTEMEKHEQVVVYGPSGLGGSRSQIGNNTICQSGWMRTLLKMK